MTAISEKARLAGINLKQTTVIGGYALALDSLGRLRCWKDGEWKYLLVASNPRRYGVTRRNKPKTAQLKSGNTVAISEPEEVEGCTLVPT